MTSTPTELPSLSWFKWVKETPVPPMPQRKAVLVAAHDRLVRAPTPVWEAILSFFGKYDTKLLVVDGSSGTFRLAEILTVPAGVDDDFAFCSTFRASGAWANAAAPRWEGDNSIFDLSKCGIGAHKCYASIARVSDVDDNEVIVFPFFFSFFSLIRLTISIRSG
jgi:hypothetical protein